MHTLRAILPIAALALGSASTFADEDDAKKKLPLTPEREIAFTVDEATWLSIDVAPDGATLVLEILGDLYRLPIAGGKAVPITTGMAFDSQPRFSPDGKRIAFVSDRSGREAIWTVAPDGSDAKRIGQGSADHQFASPSWAPDGSHVVVSRTDWSLATYELWAYHVDGGKGVQLTRAKRGDNTPAAQRHNAIGAVYSPSGRYLYYAQKHGGFGYNVALPLWQIARWDLVEGYEDPVTQAIGSAFRPALSPDGRLLVYGTRHEHVTGLRLRDLTSGDDHVLVRSVQFDEQEARFTRDLLPGYAFTPDGEAVIYTSQGRLWRVAVATGEVTPIPFQADVEAGLGPRLHFPYRLGTGPIKARVIRDPQVSPDGKRVAFAAFTGIYVHEFDGGRTRKVSPDDLPADHAAWSPDGRQLAFVSWSAEGGHVWRMSAGGGRPRQVSAVPAYYSDPVWSPDGERIVALRASRYDRLYRDSDFGAPVGSDVIWLPASGGDAKVIVPARGLARPHFGPERDRVYLYLRGDTAFPRDDDRLLVSVRFDGTDRRDHLSAVGPGLFNANGEVGADDIRLAPDGQHALIQHANQVYVARLLTQHLRSLHIDLTAAEVPLELLTEVGGDFVGWADASNPFWSAGHTLYRRPLASMTFEPRDEDEDNGDNGDNGEDAAGANDDTANDAAPEDDGGEAESNDAKDIEKRKPLPEQHEAVAATLIEIWAPRQVPEGKVALAGATVLTMARDEPPIANAIVLIEGDRIAAVGDGTLAIPDGYERIDVSGKFIVPGYVDTHAHFQPMRRVLDTSNWAFLANLAYGVTTGLDVQPSTVDILTYQDLIDAGQMTGPRALSTGPGVFSNNAFRSKEQARAVLSRYRDHYRVHNLKAYISGSREQRQWLAQAALELRLMPTTEGALDMKLDITHVLDGFNGNEHNFPVIGLAEDVVRLVAQSGIGYTPTLIVSYGGPAGENWFYTHEPPLDDAKLRRFVPYEAIARRSLRRPWFHEREYNFQQVAADAARIVRAGGNVGVGAHGQLQGLGYHWEMRALGMGGMTPLEVLTSATRMGAEMIGVGQDLGTVTAGKLADLVVLNADPTVDLRAAADLHYVVKGGVVFDGATLDRVWPDPHPLPPQWWWQTR